MWSNAHFSSWKNATLLTFRIICVCRVFDIITSVSENNIVLPKGILFYEIIKAIIIRYGVVCAYLRFCLAHKRNSLFAGIVRSHSQWWICIACINIINKHNNALIRAIFSFHLSLCFCLFECIPMIALCVYST